MSRKRKKLTVSVAAEKQKAEIEHLMRQRIFKKADNILANSRHPVIFEIF